MGLTAGKADKLGATYAYIHIYIKKSGFSKFKLIQIQIIGRVIISTGLAVSI